MSDEEITPEEYMAALDEAQEVVKSAISNYLQIAKQGSLLVTKFAVVAETYQTEDDGRMESKTLAHFFDDNMAPWDVYGMLSMVSKDVWMDSRESYFIDTDDED